jgi:tRNA(Arg) A34 adenosine deaminase TadA
MDVNDTIAMLAKSNGLGGRHIKFLKTAYKEAQESSFSGFSLGCVIVDGNKIVGRGHNSEKSNPMQKYYNKTFKPYRKGKYSGRQHSLHAEMSAIRSLESQEYKNLRAYIVRISVGKDYGIGLAAPCAACAHALADAGVKEVFFSTDYGFGRSGLSPIEGMIGE